MLRIKALWHVLLGKPLIYRGHYGPIVVQPDVKDLAIIQTRVTGSGKHSVGMRFIKN